MKLPEFGVEKWLNDYEKKAIYDISQSSIASFTLAELINLDGTSVEDFFARLKDRPLNYGDIEGSVEFKKQVAKLYSNVDYHNILQTNGATGANLLALYALIEPNDHVISLLPSYQQLYDIPKSLGAKVDFIVLKEENNWQLDIEELRKLIKKETKMICLNSANNPTGTFLDRKLLEEIVTIARSVDAYVLVDEVYAPLSDEDEYVAIADIYEKGISINSLSKTFSIPGIRIGWVACNKELADIFRKYRDYTMICNGVLSDELAIHALKNEEKIIQRNKKIVSENLIILKDWINKQPKASLVVPNFVSTSFVRLDIKEDIETFCINLLKETGVLLVPGSAFGLDKYVRLGYCCKKETLIKGLELLSNYLKKTH